ncbi:hypothetical protein CPB84DRAFT_1786110 [Gymnopilus junonius]|uniref:DUF6533 domain-containing protein n=1 Tax=Gymnopilus junonius TaxID=109634 RepID=A0A9P5NJ95_GYMJU|nr:hypothetical protein CPB84DRAFT_1786110 [Gymnopilus junonius]
MAQDEFDPILQTQALINEYFQLAALVILYYDYILTLKDEIERYWSSRTKLNLGFALFVLNRYLSILGNIPILLLSFWTWPGSNRLQVCVGMSQYQEYLIAAVHLVVDFIAIVRTYAIYSSSRRILGILIAAGAALLGYGVHAIVGHQQTPYTLSDLPAVGCLLPTTPDLSPS